MTNAELADEIEPYVVRGDNPKLTFLQWVKIIAALRQPSSDLAQSQARVAELEKAAEAMCESFKDHADRCRICTLNWQNLKAALKDRA